MANNAKRGLELRREYGRGGTSVGVARARDLSNRKNLSADTVRRMFQYFSRHEVDKQAKG
jgi:ribosomal protein S15P/S13E